MNPFKMIGEWWSGSKDRVPPQLFDVRIGIKEDPENPISDPGWEDSEMVLTYLGEETVDLYWIAIQDHEFLPFMYIKEGLIRFSPDGPKSITLGSYQVDWRVLHYTPQYEARRTLTKQRMLERLDSLNVVLGQVRFGKSRRDEVSEHKHIVSLRKLIADGKVDKRLLKV